MWLNAYKLPEWKIPPAEYIDVTNDTEFRACVIEYVKACDIVRTGMIIKEYDLPYDWLKRVSNSPKGFDMNIKFFDDYYFLQVRYFPDFYRTEPEHSILWSINIVTVVSWVLFAFTLWKPPIKKEIEK
jgi:hypothetical protein